jgi:transcriptional regulator with XRE-family HTH domain/tetratricopeptide (TPR) repeat protein
VTNFDAERQADAIKRIRQAFDMIQSDLAKAMEVDRSQVSNWENSSKDQEMSRKSRGKLARVIGAQFQSMEQTKAFLEEVNWTFTEDEWLEAQAHFKPSDLPVSTAGFIGRENVLAQLKGHLLSRGATKPLIILVEGMAGVGKTWLVAHLLQVDPDISRRFSDGFCWMTMEPPLSGVETADLEQQAFRSLIGKVFSREELRSQELRWDDHARARVREKLAGRHILLVIDGVEDRIDLDKWRLVNVLSGKVVVITRRKDLSSEKFPERVARVSLRAMPADISQHLLERDVDIDVSPGKRRWLIETLGGIPLALDIANHLAQQDRGFSELVRQLEEEIIPALKIESPNKKGDSVRLAFELSYRGLDGQAKRAFHALGIFPQPFDVEAIAHVLEQAHNVIAPACRRLSNLSLLNAKRSGQYTTHRLLHEYAHTLLNEQEVERAPEWKKRFARYYVKQAEYVATQYLQGNRTLDDFPWVHVDRGFEYAAEYELIADMLDYLRYTSPYIALRKDVTVFERWKSLLPITVFLQGPSNAAFSTLLGQICVGLGYYDEAIFQYKCACKLWKQMGYDQQWLEVAIDLYRVLAHCGRLREASHVMRLEDLQYVADELEPDDPLTPHIWIALGDHLKYKHCFKEALNYYFTAYRITQKYPLVLDTNLSKALLMINIGETFMLAGELEQALDYLQQGMQAADMVGDDLLWGMNALTRIKVLLLMECSEDAGDALMAARPRLGPLTNRHLVRGLLEMEEQVAESIGDVTTAEQARRARFIVNRYYELLETGTIQELLKDVAAGRAIEMPAYLEGKQPVVDYVVSVSVEDNPAADGEMGVVVLSRCYTGGSSETDDEELPF